MNLTHGILFQISQSLRSFSQFVIYLLLNSQNDRIGHPAKRNESNPVDRYEIRIYRVEE